jgi:hypothetical protein
MPIISLHVYRDVICRNYAGGVVTRRVVAPTHVVVVAATHEHETTFVDLLPNTSYLVSVTARSLLVQGGLGGGVQAMNVTGMYAVRI